MMDILWLLIGLVLILVGANALTDGASALAQRMGVSDLIIGLTVVAFGTSAPELVVSIISAIEGSPGLAIGNVVGSNIFSVLTIIGVTAMVRPIVIERSVMVKEFPIMLASAVVMLVLGNSAWLNGQNQNIISRVDGIFLLFAFVLFLRHTFSEAKAHPAQSAGVSQNDNSGMPLWKAILWVVVGLGALIWGGDRFVVGASGIARALGVSEAIIGLTIVAIGTSCPELATSIVSALKGKPGLAVGNVVGSCIFNVFLILGVSSVVCPLQFVGIGNVDLLWLLGGSVLFCLFGWFFRVRTITRIEGAILTLAYMAYMLYLILQ